MIKNCGELKKINGNKEVNHCYSHWQELAPCKVKLKSVGLSSTNENQQALLKAVELQGFTLHEDMAISLFQSVIFHGLIWRKVVLSLYPFKELIQLLGVFICFL